MVILYIFISYSVTILTSILQYIIIGYDEILVLNTILSTTSCFILTTSYSIDKRQRATDSKGFIGLSQGFGVLVCSTVLTLTIFIQYLDKVGLDENINFKNLKLFLFAGLIISLGMAVYLTYQYIKGGIEIDKITDQWTVEMHTRERTHIENEKSLDKFKKTKGTDEFTMGKNSKKTYKI